jgi:CheY-like chemotaxis protein
MKRVLIIDDDPAFVGLLEKAFELTKQYEVSSSGDARAVLTEVEKNAPDIILLDVRMPAMNGIEFLRALRASEKGKDIPVIMTTNDSSLETMSESAELNVRGYVLKANESLKSIVELVDRVFVQP